MILLSNMRNPIPAAIFLVSLWVIILIPFRVIGYGFMPPDDAMRHSAKIISEKDWGQILVLRDAIKMDSYPGWHAILGLVHKITGWGQHDLVLFSVIFLAILFCAIPIFFLQYPESWLLSLLSLSIIEPEWLFRLFLGRPYIFTMASLLVILFIWPGLKEKRSQYKNILILSAIVALSVWVHASWYFFLLLIVAFILAREWRASILIALSSVIGVLIGASLTGHPVVFLRQEMSHLLFVFGSHDVERQLVSELRPMVGDFRIVMAVFVILGWRALRGTRNKKAIDNPVFILLILTFALGIITKRIWLDWGVPAFAVWMAKEFDGYFKAHVGPFSLKRIILAAVSAAVLFTSITTDVNGRWSLTRPADYISEKDRDQKEWLPAPGGIIYSDDMGIFYQTFYKNPKADWRYILGFESSFMPQEDLATLRNIQKDRWTYKTFEPWVKKMRIEDRLIIRGNEDSKPKIPELEWKYVARDTWSGRKPIGIKK